MNNSDLSQWMEAYPGPVLFVSIVAKSRYLAYGAWCVYVRVLEANTHTLFFLYAPKISAAQKNTYGVYKHKPITIYNHRQFDASQSLFILQQNPFTFCLF